ncbi:porphobilinogen deaminase [Aspergillus costaricaensis CBS 115574]|uniref:Porphobilinogen deaminase n=1 Tax=Aspergillus costaricaensis CBS 115574 TaxID=1448317 RepID=A0ACD1IM17_9EURO|nr:porphobilinogen deaminase [Aspergillus costaricaensis CBS 115574]RAK91402.1 porphobilinogen deaminase [Aspergillus costaricaensis CBS 115574]
MSQNTPPTVQELRLGTRNSKLALVQAEHVSKELTRAHPGVQFPWQTVVVRGDVDKSSPFLKFAGPSDAAKNIWTEEMETKLCAGELDLLVHCLKDMPTRLPENCTLGAIVYREDPTDALVMKEGLRSQYTDLSQLPPGSVVGTSSTRRKALLRYRYPHLKVEECRGNLGTRLRKLDDPEGSFSAIILATAGMVRINLEDRITKRFPPSEFPYAVGQGALGIEIRKQDTQTETMVRKIEDLLTRQICLAERSLLRTLQGGCSSPVAVQCTVEQPPTASSAARLRLDGTIIHPHGTTLISERTTAEVGTDEDAEALGATVAQLLLANGGQALLEEIRLLQETITTDAK